MFYGSKDWANQVLRICARKCSEATQDTALNGIRSLCLWSIWSLSEYGFTWQAERVRNHFHRYLQRLKVVDSKRDGEALIYAQ